MGENQGLNHKQYVSLWHYIERLIDERQKQIDNKFIELEKASNIASKEMERRLEGLNELRSDVISDRAEFVKTESFRLQISGIEKAINEFEKRITIIETRSITWSAAILIFLVILQIILKFFV